MTQEENQKIEIPFGAKDSELCGWEYTIPEGMEAEIVDGKVIVRKKAGYDERMLNEIIDYFKSARKVRCVTIETMLGWAAWLEKCKEQKSKLETWPDFSNCRHNCKICMAKCFYRKEPYRWKPTEKQLEELHKYTPDNRVLTELYDGLQTL